MGAVAVAHARGDADARSDRSHGPAGPGMSSGMEKVRSGFKTTCSINVAGGEVEGGKRPFVTNKTEESVPRHTGIAQE